MPGALFQAIQHPKNNELSCRLNWNEMKFCFAWNRAVLICWRCSCRSALARRSRVWPPPRSATFFCGDRSWNIFYGHSLPSAGQLSVSGERICTILVNHLEDWACPVNLWLGKLTALDMIPLGWLGRKTSNLHYQPKSTREQLIFELLFSLKII